MRRLGANTRRARKVRRAAVRVQRLFGAVLRATGASFRSAHGRMAKDQWDHEDRRAG